MTTKIFWNEEEYNHEKDGKVKNVNGVGVLDTDNESAFYMPFNGATGIKVQY